MSNEHNNRATATGNVFTANGNIVNMGDLAQRQDDANLLTSVRDGIVYSATYMATLAQGAIIRFVQDVPAGEVLRAISFDAESDADIEFNHIVGGAIGTVLTTLDNNNADRRITAQCPAAFKIIDSHSGGRLVDTGLVSTARGANKISATLSSVGLGGIYNSDGKPVFIIENKDVVDANIILRWVWRGCA